MWSTHPIYTKSGAATAFIVECHDHAGRKVPVVVTSAHVLKKGRQEPLLIGARIPDEKGDLTEALLGVAYQGNEPYYTLHPVHDVAAFPLGVPQKVVSQLHLSSALIRRGIKHRHYGPRPGMEVGFLGYPDLFPGTAGGFAILRSGRVSSSPMDGPHASGTFLVDADVYPGDSGAPVYQLTSMGRPQLSGMIIQRVSAPNSNYSHLAIAVDSKAIDEVLELLAIKEGWRSGSR